MTTEGLKQRLFAEVDRRLPEFQGVLRDVVAIPHR